MAGIDRIPGSLNLYIGGIMSIRNKIALEKANITHVLTVLQMERPEKELFASFKDHLVIGVHDVDDENLLEHFATTNAFIQSGLDQGGGVLVHCAMGKSRSAAVCIAFLLHRKLATSPQTALELIQQSRALCEPNDGFMNQLVLYHEMGCPKDVLKDPAYQRWLYQRGVDESVACGRGPEADIVRFEDEQLDINSLEHVSEIKCRKCRRMLATTPFIVPHEERPNKKRIPSSSAQCAHIFLHPLTWMRQSLYPSTDASPSNDQSLAEEAPLSGRLICPNSNCGCNIGKFAWQGMQCSCGVWVTPAIGVLRAKVDVVDASVRNDTAKATGVNIRLPPGMRKDVEPPSNGRGNL